MLGRIVMHWGYKAASPPMHWNIQSTWGVEWFRSLIYMWDTGQVKIFKYMLLSLLLQGGITDYTIVLFFDFGKRAYGSYHYLDTDCANQFQCQQQG